MKLMKGTVLAVIDLWRAYETMGAEYRAQEDVGELAPMEGALKEFTNPTTHKFHCLVANLADDARAELVALLWLGRGDGTKDDFAEMVRDAKEQSSEGDSSYLGEKPHLDEHLIRGMELLGL